MIPDACVQMDLLSLGMERLKIAMETF